MVTNKDVAEAVKTIIWMAKNKDDVISALKYINAKSAAPTNNTEGGYAWVEGAPGRLTTNADEWPAEGQAWLEDTPSGQLMANTNEWQLQAAMSPSLIRKIHIKNNPDDGEYGSAWVE